MATDTRIAAVRRVPRLDVERIALTALAISLLAASLAFAGLHLAIPADGTDVGGTGNPFASSAVTISTDAGYSGTSPFLDGDRIIALAGRSIESWAASLLDPATDRPALRPGEPIGFTIERAGRTEEVLALAARFDAVAALAEEWGVLLFALSVQLVGLYLFARRPDDSAVRALLVTGTGMFASTIPWALGLRATDIAGAVGFWLYVAGAGAAYSLFWSGALHFALVFPRPYRAVRSRRRLITIAYVIPIGLQLGAIVLAGIASGRALPMLEAWMAGQVVLQVAVVIAAGVLMAFSYWRLSDPVSRLQLRWVANAIGLVSVGSLVLWFGPELVIGEPILPRSAVALLGLPFPIALVFAVTRRNLFGLNLVVNRSIVYGGLTAGIVATYAATVVAVSGLIPSEAPFAATLLGAGAVAVVALPLRDRLQRSVDRLMYGDRYEPDRAIRRLGRRLEYSIDPNTVLPTLVETVAEALRSPYVAIELDRDGSAAIHALVGAIPEDATGTRDLVRLPIVYRGSPIGRLAVAPRAARETLSDADLELLADLARQAAPAVAAVRLTAELRRSREALVATREEERRRLRRDLHDELGAGLAGAIIKLGAARSFIGSDPDRARRLLADLETDTRASIDEIRRIAYALRPPALDELGLTEALRQAVAGFDQGSLDRRLGVSFDAPEALPALPAAVEVAALRIALEGLANAVRHSMGSHVRVSLMAVAGHLVIEVTDDGVGVAPSARHGVGMASMQERTDELGGTVSVVPRDGGGTRVIARLPIAADPS